MLCPLCDVREVCVRQLQRHEKMRFLLWRNVWRIEFLSDWWAEPTFADPLTACTYIVTRVLKCAMSISASLRETAVEVILSEF